MSKKDRQAGEAPSRARNENSGLIDLDALLREAATSSPDLAAAAAASTGSAATPGAVAAPMQSAAPRGQKATPAAPAVAPVAAPAAAAKAKAKAPVKEPSPTARHVRSAAESLDGIAAPTSSAAVAASVEGSGPVAVAAPGAPPQSRSTPSAPTPAARPASRRRALVVVVAGVAAAACFAVLAYRDSGPDSKSASRATIAPIAAAARTVAPPSPAPLAATAPALDPADLPSAPSDAELAALAAASAPAAPAAPPRGGAPSARARAEEPEGAKVSTVVLPDAPVRDPNDLGDAMRGAVGANATADLPSATKTAGASARTLRPSPGAVVGALNGVLPAARACLAPDDPVRTAAVTFRSDGSVAQVDIPGARTTDACVRSSLAKARIEPFADETFVTRVTVRP